MFFSDLLQCASSGAQTSVDLYLRVLLTIDEEVVDRQIIHTQEVGNSMYWINECTKMQNPRHYVCVNPEKRTCY